MLSAYMAMIDDKELCSEFEKFYYDSRVKAMRVAFGVLADHALAEDAVSESFMKLAKCFQKVHNLPSHKLDAYFVITVKNTAINMLKKESAVEKVEYDDELAHGEFLPSETGELDRCIEKLSDTDREILYLRCSLGLDYAQISSALGISEQAARKRLSYARGKLKAFMEEKDDE